MTTSPLQLNVQSSTADDGIIHITIMVIVGGAAIIFQKSPLYDYHPEIINDW